MAKKQKSRVIIRLLVYVFLVSVAAILLYTFSGKPLQALFGVESVSKIIDRFNQQLPAGSQNVPSQTVKYKFAILSDSHEDTTVYPQLVNQIKARDDLDFVVHLGDQSNAGEIQKLQESKAILDTIEEPVYVLPGDHDSNWVPRRDLANFKHVFSLQQTSYSVLHIQEKFIFIDNSSGNQGVSSEAWDWLRQELESSQGLHLYVFMSTPLSNPYLSFKTMGSQNEKVKQQAVELGELLSMYKVRAIFAGDTHTFSQYKDKLTGIPIITVGASGTNKNPLPLYVVVEILSDGSYNVSSVPLKQ